MKKVPAKKTKKSKPKRELLLFLSYPEHVIMTGKFPSADDSIDKENRTLPLAGDIVKLEVDDPARIEDGEDLLFKVLEVDTKKNSNVAKITLQLYGDHRIAISRLDD